MEAEGAPPAGPGEAHACEGNSLDWNQARGRSQGRTATGDHWNGKPIHKGLSVHVGAHRSCGCTQVDSRERELSAANEALSSASARVSAAELDRNRHREALQEAEARGNSAMQEASSLRAQLQVRGACL